MKHKWAVAFVHWLRQDRWFTDEYNATQSLSQYGLIEGRESPDQYGTSILGRINGVLPKLGLVMVVYVYRDEPVPPYFAIRWRWW